MTDQLQFLFGAFMLGLLCLPTLVIALILTYIRVNDREYPTIPH